MTHGTGTLQSPLCAISVTPSARPRRSAGTASTAEKGSPAGGLGQRGLDSRLETFRVLEYCAETSPTRDGLVADEPLDFPTAQQLGSNTEARSERRPASSWDYLYHRQHGRDHAERAQGVRAGRIRRRRARLGARLGVSLRPTRERLVEQLNPAAGDRCLDLACGSGLVARAFAARVGPALVTAVDLSSLQVEHARRALAGAGLAGVCLEVRDAERLGFAPASFERVGCGFGISHFPRPIVALRGVFRILSPGGRAGFTVWGPWSRDLGFRLDSLLVRIVPALESLPVRPEDEALDRVVEQNSQPGRLDAMLRAAGFERVRHRVHALVVHHPDATSFVDASLVGYEADFDALELDADARAGIRDS